ARATPVASRAQTGGTVRQTESELSSSYHFIAGRRVNFLQPPAHSNSNLRLAAQLWQGSAPHLVRPFPAYRV
ncbi:MAG: hypothetical protein ACREFG_04640, partial [Chthoniobacterales bacterium]